MLYIFPQNKTFKKIYLAVFFTLNIVKIFRKKNEEHFTQSYRNKISVSDLLFQSIVSSQ